jgi:uncharacterized protein YecT (DUF1311 family)
MLKTVIQLATLLCWCQPAHSEGVPPEPHTITSRGVIAFQATENYKTALNSCFPGTRGNAPHGPQYLACLKEKAREETAFMDNAYKGTISYLRSSPTQIVSLRKAQRAWEQFRDANCEFARRVAPKAMPMRISSIVYSEVRLIGLLSCEVWLVIRDCQLPLKSSCFLE